MRDRPTDAHRTIAETKVGRKLLPNEVVDHLDTDKTNDNPVNLDVKTRSQHSREHTNPARRRHAKLVKALTMPQRREKLY